MAGGSGGRLRVHHFPRDLAQVDRLVLRLDAARLQPRQREQVLRELLQLVGALADPQGEAPRGLRLVGGAFGEHLRGCANGRHRILQLVRHVGDEVLQGVALLQLPPHRLERVGERAHLAPSRLGQRRLPFPGGDALRRPGEPLDGAGHRASDQHRQRSRGDGEHQSQQRHLGRHVAHQLNHPEGRLADAHPPAARHRRLRGDAGHVEVGLARLEDDAPFAVEQRHVRVDGAAGERLQDGPQRIPRSARGQLGDGACLVLGGAGGEERSARGEPVDDDPGEHGGEQQRGRGERDEHLKPQRQTRAPRLEQAHDGGAQAEEEEQREREEELLPTHL